MCFSKKVKYRIRDIVRNAVCGRCALIESEHINGPVDAEFLKETCCNKACRKFLNKLIQKLYCEVALPLIKKGGKHASERTKDRQEEA